MSTARGSRPVQPAGPAYRLLRQPPPRQEPRVLDEYQRAVVEHPGGPLLVLAGPGTGKTTTLVETVTHRIEQRGLHPDQVLLLTFSRKAALELKDRVTARLGRTSGAPLAFTFHSFCYALLRQYQAPDLYTHPIRLLIGPEQDVVVSEMLRYSGDLGAVDWPEHLRACLGMRGFAEEVRAVIARTRELGLDPEDLERFAKRAGRQDWAAVARFLDDYLDVLDARGVIDYTELVHRAVLLVERDEVREELRDRFRAVFVDEYQDTDPAQVRLLRALAGDGRDLIVVGDPDQSIYAFRGADVSGILDFRTQFPKADGSPADVVVLRVSRRCGERLLAASREVARRMPLTRLPAEQAREHRELVAAENPYGPGHVEARTYPTLGAELDGVADLLRRAHLEDGIPWGEMAVLVRSGTRSIPMLRRVLTAAGVPLEVAGDELPLREEPAVRTLLDALRVAADPTRLTPERAEALLRSPLAGLDAADLRRLGRTLRAEERLALSARGGEQRMPRPAAELIREALAEPERLVAIEDESAAKVAELGRLLQRTRAVLAEGGTAEEALWEIWSGTRWPERLAAASRRGGPAGRKADRDLDAVCELFETAARAVERIGHTGVENFLAELDAQRIPGDTLSERAVRGDAVRLLTAHRAKGLEWRLVVVTGVQEGVWPDLRRRGSLLEADRIGPDGLTEPMSLAALLAEERRLFYVAVTRARERLVVTAVESAHDDGEQPSRFLDELGVPIRRITERPRRPLSIAGLVAELRATLTDPTASDALKHAAAQRLALLAAEQDEEGDPLVPAAHPDRWWGLVDLTDNDVPVRDPGQPVALSASAVQGLAECPLQWFLGREVRAESPRTSAVGFGSVLHVLADDVAHGRAPAELAALMERLDRVWDQLAFEAPWQSAQQKEEARAALARFLVWHTAERGRMVVDTEREFSVTLQVGEIAIQIRGFIDRVEADAEGRAYLVDFKTGKTKLTREELARHPQLGLYQLAVEHGALDSVPHFRGRRPELGGAELVQLRIEDSADGMPLVQTQSAPRPDGDGSTWVERLLVEAARRVLNEEFTPMSGNGCERCEFRRCCTAWPEGRQVIE
ncbi:helicase UvrD [Carbonactinospora thermoautotrophica]|uniref:DNA 3'-5' helicase n=2 Tax=Carbonactinospora thermoautotrophica TaxID=1469144 RepID=A0A132N220_9ACTN|nr:helicase UvrD [Carbonactinospora thermoautotrophica]